MVKALIIIDMIKGYKKDTDDPQKIIQNQIKLINEFKKNKLKVILSIPGSKEPVKKNPVMLKLWGEEFKDEPGEMKLVEEFSNIKFDKIVLKPEYSSFYKTDLERYCIENEIDELYFTGVFTACCIYFSAVDAAYRHIQPYLITDASGSAKKSSVSDGWEKDTFSRFKMMIGPLTKTSEVIEVINR